MRAPAGARNMNARTPALNIPSLRGSVSDEEWQLRVDLAACYRLSLIWHRPFGRMRGW
jgi:hypothetical protein